MKDLSQKFDHGGRNGGSRCRRPVRDSDRRSCRSGPGGHQGGRDNISVFNRQPDPGRKSRIPDRAVLRVSDQTEFLQIVLQGRSGDSKQFGGRTLIMLCQFPGMFDNPPRCVSQRIVALSQLDLQAAHMVIQ